MRALLLAALLPLVKPKIMCSLHLTTNVDGEEVVYKLDYEDTEEGLQHAARQFVEVAKPMLDGCDTTACIIDVIAEHARAEAACDHDDPADRARQRAAGRAAGPKPAKKKFAIKSKG